ncbi:unnamed protein product [Discosporangium mesarthrocarpum]
MNMNSILATINDHRRRHGSPPYEWSVESARRAQEWASRGVFEQRRSDRGFGENLAFSPDSDPTRGAIRATNRWQEEGNLYDYNNPRFSTRTGNFTANI